MKIQNRSEIVWNELIKLNKKEGWHFGQYENEKCIETSFKINDGLVMKFQYSINENNLIFRAVILSEFNIDSTNDIMVLSSHFNGLLNRGIVRVDIKYNYVEYVYSGNLLLYLLFPEEIHFDIERHYNITKDCFWAYSTMLKSGDNPVFVIAELLERVEKENQG